METRTTTTLLLIAALAGCSQEPAPGGDPVFDWFEYAGSDAVHEGATVTDSTYLNPIIAGFYPDPSIVRVGDDFYLVQSSFAYFPGIPVFHSRDLVSWTQIGNVIERESQADFTGLGVSQGVFAPTIRHKDGLFYVINTLVNEKWNVVFTATDPAGPWSEPYPFSQIDGIDPSILFDDDGKAYITNNGPPPSEPLYEGHRALYVREFDPVAMTTGPPRLAVDGGVDLSDKPIWIEAPHLFKVDGLYYLIAAEGGTEDGHSQVVFRSESPMGPFTPGEVNPILTQRHIPVGRAHPVTSSGHADFVQTAAGDWWAVFLATRPYADDRYYNTGRETFLLPVEWEDGWPTIVGGLEPIQAVQRRPNLAPDPNPAPPTTGTFSRRYDFDEPLSHEWLSLRAPYHDWVDLRSTPGWLQLTSGADSLSGTGRPTYVALRQRHLTGSARTAVRYTPGSSDDRAGLVAFQSEGAHLMLLVTGSGVEVIAQDGTDERTLGSVGLDVSGTVFLRIDFDGGDYDFYAATSAEDWTAVVENIDGRLLSTLSAGGFVGTTLGMYAHSPRVRSE
ncbi:MAG: glycoside hydrolase family 43 protein [Rhodothermales bacterium]|nr:glycoside hydrolase family 43 protein [Rhodothermales bacterium]